MEFLRNRPTGVDAVIDRFQRALFKDLTINTGWRTYDCYPRVYKNIRGKEVIPEYFKGGKDYEDVRFNDKKTATSFFLAAETRTLNDKQTVWTHDITIVFQARLDKLYKDWEKDECICDKDRRDEKVINDVRQSLRRIAYDKYKVVIATGVDKVYSDLKLTPAKLFTDDMNKFSVCKFTITMLYTNSDKNPSRI